MDFQNQLPGDFSPLVYAQLASNVYRKNNSAPIPDGWQMLTNAEIENLDKDGYYGAAYINNTTKEIIIAHRGTDTFLTDKLDDGKKILQGEALDQFHYALQFTLLVRSNYQEPTFKIISHTGHSMGSYISHYMSAVDNIKSVSFDAPGSLEMLNSERDNGNLSQSDVDYVKNNAINFNAAPSFVNTIKTPAGKVIRLYPPYDVEKTKDDYMDYLPLADSAFSLQQHDMGGLVKCFNPTTGLPSVYSIPSSWPTDGKAWFMDYRSNPHYWNEIFDKNLVSPVDGPNGEEYSDFSTKESRLEYNTLINYNFINYNHK